MTEDETAEPITGQKRAWEPGAPPPDGAPPAEEPTEAAPAPEDSSGAGAAEEPVAEATGDAAPMAVDGAAATPGAPPTTPANGAAAPGEEQALQGEAAWLRQQIPQLQTQLSQLQQQHATLTQQQRAHAAAAQHHAAAAHHQQMQMQAHHQQMQQQQPQQAPAAAHNAQWTEQVNPENGGTYYWNQVTGESTWTRPADYNPSAAGGGAPRPAGGGGGGGGGGGPNTKGPPGANLFVVRKMRRGEFDEFNDNDLRTEFGKFGTVTRAEMTMDKETGWSKGVFCCPPPHLIRGCMPWLGKGGEGERGSEGQRATPRAPGGEVRAGGEGLVGRGGRRITHADENSSTEQRPLTALTKPSDQYRYLSAARARRGAGRGREGGGRGTTCARPAPTLPPPPPPTPTPRPLTTRVTACLQGLGSSASPTPRRRTRPQDRRFRRSPPSSPFLGAPPGSARARLLRLLGAVHLAALGGSALLEAGQAHGPEPVEPGPRALEEGATVEAAESIGVGRACRSCPQLLDGL